VRDAVEIQYGSMLVTALFVLDFCILVISTAVSKLNHMKTDQRDIGTTESKPPLLSVKLPTQKLDFYCKIITRNSFHVVVVQPKVYFSS